LVSLTNQDLLYQNFAPTKLEKTLTKKLEMIVKVKAD
jgi:hypothetical protein